jgi:hypothetical protein
LGGGNGADFGLVGPGGDNDGDRKLAHEAKATGWEDLQTAALWPDDFNDAVHVNEHHLVLT